MTVDFTDDPTVHEMRATLREMSGHVHPVGVDGFCNARSDYMGDHMAYVLELLDAAQAEVERLRAASAARYGNGGII